MSATATAAFASSLEAPRVTPWLGLIRRHPVRAFFALAFAFSWAIMIPLTLSSYGLFPFPGGVPLLIVMGYGPTFAAIAVTAALGGWPAVRALLARLLIWRVGWRWYAVALLLNGALVLGAIGLYAVLGGVVPAWPEIGPGLLIDIVITFLVVTLVNGEEIGWRGFALPVMQARWGVPLTVLMLGTIEALFHLPIFFNNGASEAGGQNGTPLLAFVASSVLAMVLFAWLFNNTRGSLLIASMFHGSMNTWSNVLPFPAASPSFFWCLAAVQLGICAVVVVFGWHTARRARLPEIASRMTEAG